MVQNDSRTSKTPIKIIFSPFIGVPPSYNNNNNILYFVQGTYMREKKRITKNTLKTNAYTDKSSCLHFAPQNQS